MYKSRVALHARGRIGAAVTAACAASLVLAVGDVGVAGAQKLTTKDPIVLGAVLAMSGSLATSSGPELVGMKAAIKQINASGGIMGRKVTLVSADDNSTPTKAAVAAQQVLAQHPVMMNVDSVPNDSNAMLPYTALEKVPTLAGAYSTTAAQAPYHFEFVPSDVTSSVVSYLYGCKAATPSGQKLRLGILSDTTTLEQARAKAIAAGVSKVGGTLAGNEQVAVTATDVTVEMSKLQSAGANVVTVQSANQVMLAAAQAANTLHWDVRLVPGAQATSAQVFGKGILPASVSPNVYAVSNRDVAHTPKTGKLYPKYAPGVKLLKSAGANLTTGLVVELNGVDAAYIMKGVIEKAHSTTGAKLKQVMEHHFKLPPEAVYNPTPNWTPTVHTMSNSDESEAWGLAQPGTVVSGTYPGIPITLPKKLSSAFTATSLSTATTTTTTAAP